jgi:hypothetical protein
MDSTEGLGEQEDRDLKQLEEESTTPSDEIRREEINPNSRRAIGIGDEVGPNDQSGQPSSEVKPDPQLDDTLDTVSPDTVTPAPIPETAPESGLDPLDSPSESAPDSTPTDTVTPAPEESSDPFSTDSFIEDPPPVTESNPNPAADPLLEPIPEPTPPNEGETPGGF